MLEEEAAVVVVQEQDEISSEIYPYMHRNSSGQSGMTYTKCDKPLTQGKEDEQEEGDCLVVSDPDTSQSPTPFTLSFPHKRSSASINGTQINAGITY